MAEKQAAITASHEIEAGGDAAHHGVAKGGGFPGYGVDWRGAKDSFGDFLISGSCLSTVDRAEALYKALSALMRYPPVRRRTVVEGSIAKPDYCIGAISDKLVDQRDGRHRTVWRAAVRADRYELCGANGEVDIQTLIRRPGVGRNDGDIYR